MQNCINIHFRMSNNYINIMHSLRAKGHMRYTTPRLSQLSPAPATARAALVAGPPYGRGMPAGARPTGVRRRQALLRLCCAEGTFFSRN